MLNPSKIIKNSSLRFGSVFCDFWEFLFPNRCPFWVPFSTKSWKKASKKRCKNRWRKSIVKRCQNEQTAMPKVIKNVSRRQFFIEQLILRKPCFIIVKAWLWRSQGAKFNEKSFQKRCENENRKKYATKKKRKWWENGPKVGAQNIIKSTKQLKKGMPKMRRKFDPEKWCRRTEI